MNVWKWKYMETRYAAADDDDKDHVNNNAYISKHKYAIASTFFQRQIVMIIYYMEYI